MNPCTLSLTPLPANRRFQPANKFERTLSSHALDALKDFYTERDARAKKFEELQAEAEERAKAAAEGTAASSSGGAGSALTYPLSMETFGEDWNESQFWVRATRLLLCACFEGRPVGRRWTEVTVADTFASSGVGPV